MCDGSDRLPGDSTFVVNQLPREHVLAGGPGVVVPPAMERLSGSDGRLVRKEQYVRWPVQHISVTLSFTAYSFPSTDRGRASGIYELS